MSNISSNKELECFLERFKEQLTQMQSISNPSPELQGQIRAVSAQIAEIRRQLLPNNDEGSAPQR